MDMADFTNPASTIFAITSSLIEFTQSALGTSKAILSFLFIAIYIIWSFVSIWRCAFNTQNKNWGYVARIFISMDLLIGIKQTINILKDNNLTN